MLDGAQQCAADPLPPVCREYGDVVDVEQWARREGGEAFEGIDQTAGPVLEEGEKGHEARVVGEAPGQCTHDLVGQGLAAAHGIARVGVEQMHEGCGMCGLVQLGRDDAQTRWCVGGCGRFGRGHRARRFRRIVLRPARP